MARDRDQTTSTPSSTQTSHNQHQTRQESQPAQTERERPIESGRERDRQTATGLARRGTPGGSAGPFSVMRRMADDMDRLFEQFGFPRSTYGWMPRSDLAFGDVWSGRGGDDEPALWSPQVETFRRGDNLVVRADIPGVSKDDIDVQIENDLLTISGERRDEHEENREGFFRSERSYGRFYRAIPLPEGVSGEQCDASFKDGVLEITIPAPRVQDRGARRVQIR